MSGPKYSLHSVYDPSTGTGKIRISFPDLRTSSRKTADELVNKQIAKIAEGRPTNTVITASLTEGSRYASSWSYVLSTTTLTPTPASPASPKRK
jgi:hypothetical protein